MLAGFSLQGGFVNRLRLALTALQTGQTLYAERGVSPVAA